MPKTVETDSRALNYSSSCGWVFSSCRVQLHPVTQAKVWQHQIMWTTSFWPSCLSNSFINSLTPLLLLLKLLAFGEKEHVYWHQSALSFFCRTDVERLESQLNGDRRSEADRQRAHPFLLFHILFKESFLPFHRKVRSNLVAVRRAFMLFWALW